MMHSKACEEVLVQLGERRGISRHRVIARSATHKGRPPPRKCPDDFDVIFVEIGRVDVETWYRASRITVNRWLKERGKARLIQERAARVRSQREQARRVKAPADVAQCLDAVPVPHALACLAADYLRASRNGGWMISCTAAGDWWVGSCRRSAGELLSMAERKGFDVESANLQLERAESVRKEG